MQQFDRTRAYEMVKGHEVDWIKLAKTTPAKYLYRRGDEMAGMIAIAQTVPGWEEWRFKAAQRLGTIMRELESRWAVFWSHESNHSLSDTLDAIYDACA